MSAVQKIEPRQEVAPKANVAAIFPALAKIQAGIHAVGVGKVRENREQRFNFRGIDDALAAFAPLLTEAGVLAVPSYASINVSERQTKSGGTTYNARVEATFTFYSTEDGSSLTAGPFHAEANDGQDKGISKATSVAYRNCLFITFCVPHEPAIGGDPDGHGEPEDDGKAHAIINDWLNAIKECGDANRLDALKKECIEKYGDRDVVPAKIKHAFSNRTKALRREGGES